jgi:hypothetical protein
MGTGTAQISAVAPWFDITNSDKRYWIRTRRRKIPGHFSESPLELFPALANLDPLPGGDVVRSRTAGDGSEGDHAPTGP